jgi:putative CocE/NonD family hydrolase
MAKLDVPAVSIAAVRNVPMEMRDGTVLRADIYRTSAADSQPVLLIRNPYGEPMVRTAPVLPAIEAGFAVVVQHCRGTGTSDGEFVTFENEAADGADTIEWCAAQPWCDGTVAMYGPSYLGMAQFAAACAPPAPGLAALRGLAPVVTPADYHWGLAYRQGAFQLGQALAWHSLKSAQQLAYNAAAGMDVSAGLRSLLAVMADPPYAHLPLRDMPAVSRILPSWRAWLDHEERDAYWDALSYRDTRDRVAAPALHVGGWFDLFLGGTLGNFTTLSKYAATDRARRGQRLIVGPWSHADRSGTCGELHFGAFASDVAAGLERTVLEFLRWAVGPDGAGEPDGPRVRLFVMGDNVWRDEDDWPLERTEWAHWYLRADGSLAPTAPGEFDPPAHYVHDPADPVPTVGGANLLAGGAGGVTWQPGPRDQH